MFAIGVSQVHTMRDNGTNVCGMDGRSSCTTQQEEVVNLRIAFAPLRLRVCDRCARKCTRCEVDTGPTCVRNENWVAVHARAQQGEAQVVRDVPGEEPKCFDLINRRCHDLSEIEF